MPISTADFEYVQAFAQSRGALVIERGKEYLVETRLNPVAEGEGFRSYIELIQAMRNGSASKSLEEKALDALTTNETLFFRDFHPFEALKKDVFPRLIAARQVERELKIWSAACSSGQEAFSLGMLIREHFPALSTWKVSILGTDICHRVLEQAKTGTFRQIEINRGLPAPLLVKYFKGSGSNWSVRNDIQSMVTFRQMNLAGSWPKLPHFDLILLRNVLIYFDHKTKAGIFDGIARHLAVDGILALGSAETPVTVTNKFEPVHFTKTTFYRLSSLKSNYPKL